MSARLETRGNDIRVSVQLLQMRDMGRWKTTGNTKKEERKAKFGGDEREDTWPVGFVVVVNRTDEYPFGGRISESGPKVSFV
jgi:hypothetical protein